MKSNKLHSLISLYKLSIKISNRDILVSHEAQITTIPNIIHKDETLDYEEYHE